MPIRTLSHLSVLGNRQSICSSSNCLSVCLSVLCAYLSSLYVLTHLAVSLYVCHWIATCLSIRLSAGLSVCQPVSLSVYWFVFLFACFPVGFANWLKAGPSAALCKCWFVYHLCLSTCFPIFLHMLHKDCHLPFCLSVYLLTVI